MTAMKKMTKKQLDSCRMTIFAELDTLPPAERQKIMERIVEWFNDKELEES